MTPQAALTDDILLWNRFRQGDDVALGQLMKRHFSALYNYGCQCCQQPDLVDDLVQELFFSLWQNRHELPDVRYVKTYLLKTLRNRLIDALRRPNRLLLRDEWDERDLFEGEFVIERQQLEEEQQQAKHIQQLVGKLTKRQREAIHLRFYQNLTNEEIATFLQISRPAAANLISTALIYLRRHWGSVSTMFLNAVVHFL